MVEHFVSWVRRRGARTRRFNPYIAGAPVFERNLFFGREALVRRAREIVRTRSLRITGERRIGKTSFLHHLRRALTTGANGEGRWQAVLVDLETVSGGGLLRGLMDEAVEGIAAGPRTRAALRVAAQHGDYGADDLRHDVGRLLEDLRARGPRPARLVWMIDEVDALRRWPDGIGDEWLAPLLTAFPHELRIVLAGVRARALGGEGAPAFADLELEPLTCEDARQLVERPVFGVFRYEAAAVDRILELSALRPHALQRLCLHSVNRMLDEGRTTIRVADVPATNDEGWADVQRD